MKHSIIFDLVGSADARTRAIRMRISYKGLRVDIRTGESIEPENWKDGRVVSKGNTRFRQSANEINNRLAALAAKADNIFGRYELLEGRCPTTEELRAELGTSAPGKKYGIHEALDEFVRTESKLNDWAMTTVKNWHAISNHLTAFDANLTFGDIERGRLDDFVSYLHDIWLRNTTVEKYIKLLRWFLRWCARKNLLSQEAVSNLRPNIKGTDPSLKELVYLEWEELEQLRAVQLPAHSSRLEVARDVFLLCCFTGLRYSDVRQLRRTDCTDTYIQIVSRKDVEGLRIELNQYSKAILDKYADMTLPGGRALPVQSGQRMNDYLKDLGRRAGLDRPIRVTYYTGSVRHDEVKPLCDLLTTHCARRTFVTVALRLGIPAEIIMSWTGHSSLGAMKPYYKIVNQAKQSAMAKFDRLK